MPENLTPDQLAERLCRRLNLSPASNAEALSAMLREALVGRFETAVAATKAACLSITEEEAERCRRAGAYPAERIAMTIASRIRLRHIDWVEAASSSSGRSKSAHSWPTLAWGVEGAHCLEHG